MKTKTLKIALILCLLSSVLSARILYVDQHLSDGFWANSYTELNSALREAQSGDEIWVARGVYVPGRDKEDSFVIKQGVKLYGGFYGGERKRSDRDLNANLTVLSGEIGDQGSIVDNSLHVILCCQTGRERAQLLADERESLGESRESSSVERERSDVSRETSDLSRERSIIDGFTIRGGNASDGRGGGGLLTLSGNPPLIQNCRFIENNSIDQGGAILSTTGMDIVSCLFNDNSSKYGGAVCVKSNCDHPSEISIKKSTFISNAAQDGAVIYICCENEVMIDSCIMLSNHDTKGSMNTLCSNGIMRNYYLISNTASDDDSISRTQNCINMSYIYPMKKEGYVYNKYSYSQAKGTEIPSEYGFNLKKRYRFVNSSLLNDQVF